MRVVSGRQGDRLLECDVDFELDLVADQPAAGLEGDVPVETPVLAIDLGLGVETCPARAVHANVEAEELDIEVDRLGDILDRHVGGDDELVATLRLDPRGYDADLRVGLDREEVVAPQVRVTRAEAGVDA